MDKDRIKGKAEDIEGRIQRQAGEWTGSEEHQAKGAIKQAKGKARNAIGQVKDAARDAARDADRDLDRRNEEVVEEKEIRRRKVA